MRESSVPVRTVQNVRRNCLIFFVEYTDIYENVLNFSIIGFEHTNNYCQNLIMNYRRLLLHLILFKVTDKSLLIEGVTKTLHYTPITFVFDMDGNVF